MNNGGNMQANGEQVMYLSADWFSDDQPYKKHAGVTTTSTSDLTWIEASDNWASSFYVHTCPWPYNVDRKIRMTLSEVEHIRKVCRSDKKLRDAMQKIAPHIEVEVDFPG